MPIFTWRLTLKLTPTSDTSIAVSGGRVGVVIVTCRPNLELLHDSIRAVCLQVAHGVVVDNGSPDQDEIRELLPPNFSMIENPDNLGVGVALNQGIRHLLTDPSLGWILTLDQDTVVSADYLQCLLQQLGQFPGRDSIGLIAGLSSRSSSHSKRLIRTEYVMTAGSLVRADVFARTKYREDFFVDQIDYDFCNQLRTNTYGILVFDWPMFKHELGAARQLIGRPVRYESSSRYYLIVRNSTILLRERRIPVGVYVQQVLRWGIAVCVFENPIRAIRAFHRGARDALRKRLTLP